MSWMIALGVLAITVGFLLIVSPQHLVRASEALNRMVTRVDDQVLKYRVGVGVSLAIAGLFLFLYAYMIAFGR